MNLPLAPPLAPMLGKLARELPEDGYVYEPKWDGFRCLVFRSGEEVDLRSRNDRPLARYFPEIVAGLLELPEEQFVIDGEILVNTAEGFDFTALLARLHPAASRVELLSRQTPARLVAFDLLAIGDEDVTGTPFSQRRLRLSRLLSEPSPSIQLTPSTNSLEEAAGWLERAPAGIDGVIARRAESPYRPGKRELVKVKRERTADCVVAGFRLYEDRPVLSSILLGLCDSGGELRHIGIASQFTEARREELLAELDPLARPLQGHPWEHGFLVEGGATGRLRGAAGRWSPEEMVLDWVPIEPVRVCEISYDHLDGDRLRHPARFKRWRPDRDPRSCGFDQFPTHQQAPAAPQRR